MHRDAITTGTLVPMVSYTHVGGYQAKRWYNIPLTEMLRRCERTPSSYNKIYTYTFFNLFLDDALSTCKTLTEIREELSIVCLSLSKIAHRHHVPTFKNCLRRVNASSDLKQLASAFKGSIENPNTASGIKAQLPQFVYGGLMNTYRPCTHSAKNMTYNSGFMQIDLDFKYIGGDKDAVELLHFIKEDECIREDGYIIFGGISPSGYGCKFLIKTDITEQPTNKLYEASQKQFAQYLQRLIQLRDDLKHIDLIKAVDQFKYTQLAAAYYNVKYSNGLVDTLIDRTDNYKEFIIDHTLIDARELQPKNNHKPSKPQPKGINSGYEEEIVKEGLEKHYNANEEEFNTNVLFKLGGYFSLFGIGHEEALKHLEKHEGIAKSLTNSRKEKFQKIIESNIEKGNFNTAVYRPKEWRKVEYKSEINKQAAKSNYKIDSYLSESKEFCNYIANSKEQTIQVVAPTGSGKNYFCCNTLSELLPNSYILLASPTTSIAEQMRKEYKVDIKTGDRHIDTNHRVKACTYEQATKLLRETPNKYILVVDEAHYFTTAASPTFKNRALNNLLDSFKYATKRILFTGTPIPNPVFKGVKTVTIEKDSNQAKSIQIIKCNDKKEAIAEQTKRAIRDGYKVFICYNNTGKGLEELKARLDGYKILTVNKTTSKDEETNILLNGSKEEKELQQYEIVIATTYIETGVSLHSDKDAKIAFIVCSSFSEYSIHQFASRYRKAKEIKVHLFHEEEKAKNYNFDTKVERAALTNNAESSKRRVEIMIEQGREFSKEHTAKAFTDLDILLINDDNVRINYLAIEASIYSTRAIQLSKDVYKLQHLLCEKYGYSIENSITLDAVTSEEDKEKMQAVRKTAKEIKDKMVKNIFKDLRAWTATEVEYQLTMTKANSAENELRRFIYKCILKAFKANDLFRHIESNELYTKIVDALEDMNGSITKMKRFKNVISVQTLLKEGKQLEKINRQLNNWDYLFYKIMISNIGDGKLLEYNREYTKEELINIFTNVTSNQSNKVLKLVNLNKITIHRIKHLMECLSVVKTREERPEKGEKKKGKDNRTTKVKYLFLNENPLMEYKL